MSAIIQKEASHGKRNLVSYETTGKTLSVWVGLLISFLLFASSVGCFVGFGLCAEGMESNGNMWPIALLLIGFCLIAFFGLSCKGFFTLQPNEAYVFTLFGKYAGTFKEEGLSWCNPFYTKQKLSLRKRNFNVEKIKVNDALGNPIEISAIVVWKVADTYQASFDVVRYDKFVETQSESALRHLAGMYPYDLINDDEENKEITLRESHEEVNENLKKSVQERLEKAGVEVLEARINHIAYAQEIAASMLQRQQAVAIIAARKKIVEGAVSMVEMALNELSRKKIVTLTDKNRAEIVGNLLIVLCGNTNAQPVINTSGGDTK